MSIPEAFLDELRKIAAGKLVQKTFDFTDPPKTPPTKQKKKKARVGPKPPKPLGPFEKPKPEHLLSQAKKNPEGFKQLADILRKVIEKNGGFVKLGLAPANTMPFSSEYNRSLRAGTKNSTVRVGAERGRYQKGAEYAATSYTGQPLGVRLKILSVETVPLSGVDALTRVGTSESIQRKHGTRPNELVDVVRFEVLGGM